MSEYAEYSRKLSHCIIVTYREGVSFTPRINYQLLDDVLLSNQTEEAIEKKFVESNNYNLSQVSFNVFRENFRPNHSILFCPLDAELLSRIEENFFKYHRHL